MRNLIFLITILCGASFMWAQEKPEKAYTPGRGRQRGRAPHFMQHLNAGEAPAATRKMEIRRPAFLQKMKQAQKGKAMQPQLLKQKKGRAALRQADARAGKKPARPGAWNRRRTAKGGGALAARAQMTGRLSGGSRPLAFMMQMQGRKGFGSNRRGAALQFRNRALRMMAQMVRNAVKGRRGAVARTRSVRKGRGASRALQFMRLPAFRRQFTRPFMKQGSSPRFQNESKGRRGPAEASSRRMRPQGTGRPPWVKTDGRSADHHRRFSHRNPGRRGDAPEKETKKGAK